MIDFLAVVGFFAIVFFVAYLIESRMHRHQPPSDWIDE
jgi:hypothetical protein